MRHLGRLVAYLAAAAQVVRPLPNRLHGLQPPVITPCSRFCGPLATLATDRKHTSCALPHEHRTHQRFTRHAVGALVARETSALLAASTRARSTSPQLDADLSRSPRLTPLTKLTHLDGLLGDMHIRRALSPQSYYGAGRRDLSRVPL
jgi:hypothetical protein